MCNSGSECLLKLWYVVGISLTSCQVLFSVYYYLLARQVSWPTPGSPANYEDLHNAFIRVLKSGLAPLPEEGGDEESLVADRPGSPAETIEKLAFDDPRAIEYRNHVRTWYVSFFEHATGCPCKAGSGRFPGHTFAWNKSALGFTGRRSIAPSLLGLKYRRRITNSSTKL